MNSIDTTTPANKEFLPPLPLNFLLADEYIGQDQNWMWDPAFDAGYMFMDQINNT